MIHLVNNKRDLYFKYLLMYAQWGPVKDKGYIELVPYSDPYCIRIDTFWWPETKIQLNITIIVVIGETVLFISSSEIGLKKFD